MDIKQNIIAAMGKIVDIPETELIDWLEIPPTPDMGDFAFPCFKLAKSMRKAPAVIASELCKALPKIPGISEAKNVGPYLNFFIDKALFSRNVLGSVLSRGEGYGSSNEGNGKTICIDYSSINIAKPFSIHHLTTTVLGHSLKRIFDHLGYTTVSINHLGDWGTQFGKMLVAFRKWGDKETVENGASMRELVKLYVKFHEEAEKDPDLNDQAREAFRQIELHDPESWELFEWFREVTLKDVNKVYELLGIKFDSYAGEAFYEDKMQAVIDELKSKQLLTIDDGCGIVDLSEYDMPPCLILKSNGGTVYPTRDITAAIYRKNTYDFHKNLYVVAYQQNLHFQQFFKVLELMGYEWAKDCVHVNFGMISMADGTLSTRKGKVVYLEDVLGAAIEKTLEIIKEKSPDLENKEYVARQVGVGAVIFGVLYSGRIKDIVFSYEKALNFDGETGPYVQYTHARCCSVMRKSAGYDPDNIDFSKLCDESSIALLRAIEALPDIISAAADKYEPFLISRAAVDICSKFNKFYYDNRIMDDDEATRNARLALTDATRITIKVALSLIGLEAPERM